MSPKYLKGASYDRIRASSLFALLLALTTSICVEADVGDVVCVQPPNCFLSPEPSIENHFCATGLAFDGAWLYVTRCNDPIVHVISPQNGSELSSLSFDPGIPEQPAALLFDSTHEGLWIGPQRGIGVSPPSFGCGSQGGRIYFWSLKEQRLTCPVPSLDCPIVLPVDLLNPSNPTAPQTARRFFGPGGCLLDGLALLENDASQDDDDQLWFGETVNRNVGVLPFDGTSIQGRDLRDLAAGFLNRSGLEMTQRRLYATNSCSDIEDIEQCIRIFRIDRNSLPLSLIDSFPTLDPQTSEPILTNSDMACDPNTFVSQGRTVLWVRTNPSGEPEMDRITAYEIEPGECGTPTAVGACCDASTGTCRDQVRQADCPAPSEWTEGVTCSELPSSCYTAHMIVLLDRTGSMQAIREDTGNTRCVDAVNAARTDINNFFDSNPPGSAVAIWTFSATEPMPLTSGGLDGFVDRQAALAALNNLAGVPCSGLTPLAEAVCEGVDHLVATFPSAPQQTLFVAVSSDGEENNSDGSCLGPPASGGSSCADFTAGSWQKKVCDHVLANAKAFVRYWNDFDTGLVAGSKSDAETGELLGTTVPDAEFFQALAEATGGRFTFVRDLSPPHTGIPAFGVTGACCVAGVGCYEAITEAECAFRNGTHQGAGSTCAAANCGPTIPTVSAWGLAVLTGLVAAAGSLVLGRRSTSLMGPS